MLFNFHRCTFMMGHLRHGHDPRLIIYLIFAGKENYCFGHVIMIYCIIVLKKSNVFFLLTDDLISVLLWFMTGLTKKNTRYDFSFCIILDMWLHFVFLTYLKKCCELQLVYHKFIFSINSESNIFREWLYSTVLSRLWTSARSQQPCYVSLLIYHYVQAGFLSFLTRSENITLVAYFPQILHA